MKNDKNTTSQHLICDFPGCNKRAREDYTHPNNMTKVYCTEHVRVVRNAEKGK